jgi:starch-binding outer membrane protein, SusD/RagB family
MSKHKYIRQIHLLILVTLISVSGCKKFLQQESFNNISVNEIFQDFEGARTTLIGCYNQLRSINYYARDISVYADITGGNVKYPVQTNQLFWNSYNFNNNETSNDLKLFYAAGYNIIYRANDILQNIDRAADATVGQKNTMRAEAYMFRAMAHFDLVRVFAQAPGYTSDRSHKGIYLRLKNDQTIVPLSAQANSVKEVYEAIVKDLDSARVLYLTGSGIYNNINPKFFFNRNMATALLTRVELYNENNQRVIDVATELLPLTGTPSIPLTTAANDYRNAWRNKNIHPESLMEIQFNIDDVSGLGNYYNYAPQVNNVNTLAATDDLLNLYTLTNDVRNRGSLFKRSTVNGIAFFATLKYQGMADTVNNIKLMRISEVYLNRAEAYAKMNMLPEALADLNRIRRARTGVFNNVNDYNNPNVTQQILIDEILNERRRELCFEGHYFFDLARNKKDISRNDCQAVMNCSINYPSNKYVIPTPVN